MSEFVDNHPLARDLPEYKDAIHTLKANDAHFLRLFDEYEALDKSIVRAEQGLEHLPDLDLDELKLKRVQLKDSLVEILRKQS
ncbi:MAG: YdcH family protein [Granulosicoccus sp.]